MIQGPPIEELPSDYSSAQINQQDTPSIITIFVAQLHTCDTKRDIITINNGNQLVYN